MRSNSTAAKSCNAPSRSNKSNSSTAAAAAANGWGPNPLRPSRPIGIWGRTVSKLSQKASSQSPCKTGNPLAHWAFGRPWGWKRFKATNRKMMNLDQGYQNCWFDAGWFLLNGCTFSCYFFKVLAATSAIAVVLEWNSTNLWRLGHLRPSPKQSEGRPKPMTNAKTNAMIKRVAAQPGCIFSTALLPQAGLSFTWDMWTTEHRAGYQMVASQKTRAPAPVLEILS